MRVGKGRIRCSRLAVFMLALVLMILIISNNTFAYNTGDDYPSEYKDYGLDLVIDRWNFYNRECTSFVAWCMESRNGIFLHNRYVTVDGVTHGISNTVQDEINEYGQKLAHAKYWGTAFQSMGFPVNNTPAVGSIAWSNVGYYGHVAWVSAVNGDEVTVEEYNNSYQYPGTFGTRTVSASSFSGYIHIKDLGGTSTADIPEGIYYLRSAINDNMVVGVANASKDWGANIQLEICTNARSQKFHIVPHDGKYAIWNDNSTLAIDVENSSNAPGANVQQYYYWPSQTNGQVWTFEESGDGYYYIRSALGTYLDVAGGVAANGQNIGTYTGNQTPAQKFRIELVEPSISISRNTFSTGDYITVEFGGWDGASSFEYYLAEYPEAFAYTTNRRHDDINWNSISFSDLSAGHYSIFVHAKNKISTSRQSNWVSFDVYDKDYIPTTSNTYNGHIYAVYDYEISWTFAQKLCEQMGGHLVTINNRNESAFLESLIGSGSKDAYWIGASNYSSSSYNQDGSWTWVTGESFSYTNWFSGEPSSSGIEGNREHWAEIRKSYSKKWNDTSNTNKNNKGFIIEIEPGNNDIVAQHNYNGNEYILVDRNTTWSEAEQYCSILGGHLVYINDSSEEEFINAFIEEGARIWYYIGASRLNGTWYWLDGSEAKNISWNGELCPDYCNYLMKYRSNKKYINLPNTYYPENDISKIGFICEIENQHHFNSEWSTDETAHWHICTDAGCSEISDRAAHSWDEGTVTTSPTYYTDGVRTFTCTVCGQTKTEQISKLSTAAEEFSIQSITVTGKLVTVAVVNDSGHGGKLLVASYEANGRFIASAFADVEETGEIKVTLNTSEADHVSAFIVDSLVSMRPVCAQFDHPVTESKA